MIFGPIGLRYERLLILSAPITFAALLVLFISFATHAQQDKLQAQCYLMAADLIEKNKIELEVYSTKVNTDLYYMHISLLLRLSPTTKNCHSLISAFTPNSKERYSGFPSGIAEKLKLDSAKISTAPINLYGVELPVKAKIEILGTKINIEIHTFTQILLMTIAPLLLLWLGSLYNTRYRETLQISNSKSITEIFGHCINIYPVGRLRDIRKPGWYTRNQAKFIATLYLVARISLLGLFILPPACAYLAALYFLYTVQLSWLYWSAGVLISLFTISNIILECIPWHSMKIFPSPLNFTY